MKREEKKERPKTSKLIARFHFDNKKYVPGKKSTTGLFFIDEEIKIVIHDTAGQERFKSLAANYIKKAKGILLVYDITDKRSFESLGNWMNDIEEEEVADKVPIILVGNKSDLEEERVISKQEGEKVAKQYNLKFYETSCKNGDNVENCFLDLARQIVDRMKEKKGNISQENIKNLNISNEKKRNRRDCCQK